MPENANALDFFRAGLPAILCGDPCHALPGLPQSERLERVICRALKLRLEHSDGTPYTIHQDTSQHTSVSSTDSMSSDPSGSARLSAHSSSSLEPQSKPGNVLPVGEVSQSSTASDGAGSARSERSTAETAVNANEGKDEATSWHLLKEGDIESHCCQGVTELLTGLQ